MKKKYIIMTIIVFSITIITIFIINLVDDESINIKNPNRIGNNTNNIVQNINISIQDDYIYYSFLEGLFMTKIDSNKKTKLDDGNISNINVVGQWIYYLKANDEIKSSGIVTHFDLYRMMINGQHKQVIIKDAYNVNIIDDKIFYINGYGVTGIYNNNDNNINNSLIVSDLNGNNKQVIIKKDVDSMVIEDNCIYYVSNDKMFVYDMDKKENTFLMDEVSSLYIVNGKSIIFYDKKFKQLNEFIIDKKEIKNITNNVKNINSIYINNDILYYTDGNTRLFAYDLDKNQKYEIDKEFGIVLFYYDKLYLLSKDEEIKTIIIDK